MNHTADLMRQSKDNALSTLGPLKDNERRDLNCAVKEYLLLAGYRLTAMTFYEEVMHTLRFLYYYLLSSFLLLALKPEFILKC